MRKTMAIYNLLSKSSQYIACVFPVNGDMELKDSYAHVVHGPQNTTRELCNVINITQCCT